jgi:hypothetical protein
MKIPKIHGAALTARSALLVFAACGSEAAGGSTDATTLEAELTAATESAGSAGSVASACFETFKGCASAAGADVASCKSELKACLPDAPPAPSCGGMSSSESDGGVARDDGDAAEPKRGRSGGRMGDHMAGMFGDGGVLTHGSRGDGGFDGDGHHDRAERGPRCRAPHLEDGALGKCRETAAASSDAAAAQTAHARCVAHAFADRIGELCTKAETLCAEPTAPSDVCARVTAACSAFAADAGI